MSIRLTPTLLVVLGITALGAIANVPVLFAQGSLAIPTVRFVYLVPSDKAIRPEYIVAIENAARHLQAWVALQLSGATYRLHPTPVEVYRTPHPESYYVGDGTPGYGFFNRGVWDGFQSTGGRYQDPNNIWVFYLDAETACGQNGGAGGSGIALVSKDDLDGLLTAKPYDRCGVYLAYPRERWIGGLGHEVGHALGLPHPAACDRGESTCDWGALMFAGYAGYPNTYFREDERLYLSRSKFISATWASRDTDGDGLNDEWESSLGLDPLVATGADGAAGDPDGDGLDNRAELAAGTHPRGAVTRLLAEGTASTFFGTSLALLNPGTEPASVLLRFLKGDGSTARVTIAVPAASRRTVDTAAVHALASSAFSTVIESDRLVVADRTMSWGASQYGAHAETSLPAASTTWYFAEGSTVGRFNLFYLIQNPTGADAVVTVTYLRPAPAPPLTKAYGVPAQSRFTIWVNQEGRDLQSTDVSGIVSADQPVIVERAMYMDGPGLPFMAGHASAGVTAAAQRWFFAEGATGPFFDLFLLIANPSNRAGTITATYLLPDGSRIEKQHVVDANSRFNIWVDLEDPRLANTAVSTIITSADVPVIAERSMWWPGRVDEWTEAHNSAGATDTGTYWALAGGEQGGAQARETYILVANTSSIATPVRVTLYLETGEVIDRTFVVGGHSRFNVSTGAEFPAAANKRFGVTVQSTGASPGQLVVERAMYWNAGGVRWAAGTNVLATKLR